MIDHNSAEDSVGFNSRNSDVIIFDGLAILLTCKSGPYPALAAGGALAGAARNKPIRRRYPARSRP